MSLSIFKIIFVVIILSFGTAAAAQTSTENTLVYKVREKADPTSMSTTESIIIHDLTTGVQHTVVAYTNSIESGMGYVDFPLVVSPDGRFVFNVGSGTQIWENRQIVELLDGYNYQWSADGQLAFIGYSDDQYDIYIWQDGELMSLGIPDTHPEIGALAAFDRAADGRFLFYGWGSRTMYVWDDGDLITTIPSDLIGGEVEEYEQILDARWSADGRIAFIAGQNPTWNLYFWADHT
ncbi:MAG TPA: hypothetical protein VHL11_16340, partial [Phototrophicaceae bacterium]|nr:hypothetical protein [Phototrophicaceae bacterium]